jgi:hypothetical protein
MSCVNRQYELARGINARGKAPQKTTPLASMRLSVGLANGGGVMVAEAAHCSGLVELILRTLRKLPTARNFGALVSAGGGATVMEGAGVGGGGV